MDWQTTEDKTNSSPQTSLKQPQALGTLLLFWQDERESLKEHLGVSLLSDYSESKGTGVEGRACSFNLLSPHQFSSLRL